MVTQFLWFVAVVIVVAIVATIAARRWKNAYVGVNMGPCAYCRRFVGKHLHYLSPTSTVAMDNYAGTHMECSVCRAYPGMLHIHKE